MPKPLKKLEMLHQGQKENPQNGIRLFSFLSVMVLLDGCLIWFMVDWNTLTRYPYNILLSTWLRSKIVIIQGLSCFNNSEHPIIIGSVNSMTAKEPPMNKLFIQYELLTLFSFTQVTLTRKLSEITSTLYYTKETLTWHAENTKMRWEALITLQGC